MPRCATPKTGARRLCPGHPGNTAGARRFCPGTQVTPPGHEDFAQGTQVTPPGHEDFARHPSHTVVPLTAGITGQPLIRAAALLLIDVEVVEQPAADRPQQSLRESHREVLARMIAPPARLS